MEKDEPERTEDEQKLQVVLASGNEQTPQVVRSELTELEKELDRFSALPQHSSKLWNSPANFKALKAYLREQEFGDVSEFSLLLSTASAQKLGISEAFFLALKLAYSPLGNSIERGTSVHREDAVLGDFASPLPPQTGKALHIVGYEPLTLPFVNREDIVRSLAARLANNLSRSEVSDNNVRFCIAVSAQMFGSGKTYFGQHFLPKLRAMTPEDGDTANNVLCSSLYVYVNVSQVPGLAQGAIRRENALAALFLTSLLTALRDGGFDSIVSELTARFRLLPMTQASLAMIADVFRKLHSVPIFLHLDEVSMYARDLLIQDFYTLWSQVLHPFVSQKNNVLCTGKTPELFLIGKQLFPSLLSPGVAVFVPLGGIKPNDVSDIMERIVTGDFKGYDALRATSGEQRAQLVEYIFRATSGVPRLVYWAFVRLQKADALQHSTYEAFAADLIEFIVVTAEGSTELNPFRAMPFDEQGRAILGLLFTLAAYQIPFEPDSKIQLPSADVPGHGYFIEMVNYFNCFIDTVQEGLDASRGRIKISIPDIVFKHTASAAFVPGLPFYQSLCADPALRELFSPDGGRFLETLTTRCVSARFSSRIFSAVAGRDGSVPLQLLFPYFQNTLCGDAIVSGSLLAASFPQVKSNVKRKETPDSESKTLSVADKARFPFAPNTMYFSRFASKSADATLCCVLRQLRLQLLQERFLFHLQMKDTAKAKDVVSVQNISEKMLCDESSKACVEGFPQVLVIITIGNTSYDTGATRTDEYVTVWGPGCTFNGVKSSFTVPDRMEVIVLKDKALEHFFSAPLLMLLRESRHVRVEQLAEVLLRSSFGLPSQAVSTPSAPHLALPSDHGSSTSDMHMHSGDSSTPRNSSSMHID